MEREEREAAFRKVEASLLLEGLDPRTVPIYRTVKAKLIDGAMSVEEAKSAISDHFCRRARSSE